MNEELERVIAKIETEFPDEIPTEMLEALNMDKYLAFLRLYKGKVFFNKTQVLAWLRSML